jgi:hypothetical protein
VSLKTWLMSLGRQRSGPSIRIVRQRREGVDLEYEDGSQTIRLSGELTGPKWKQMNVRLMQGAWSEELLDKIASAIAQRGYEFAIYRLGEAQTISEPEREAALAELQSMGYQIEVSPDRKRIRQSLAPGAPRPSLDEAKKGAPKIMKLIETVHGTRRPIEVLRKSDSAVI